MRALAGSGVRLYEAERPPFALELTPIPRSFHVPRFVISLALTPALLSLAVAVPAFRVQAEENSKESNATPESSTRNSAGAMAARKVRCRGAARRFGAVLQYNDVAWCCGKVIWCGKARR